MDVVLQWADSTFLTEYVYPEWIPEDNMYRQFASLFVLVSTSAAFFYLTFATLAYYFIFDHNLMKHKLFLKNQVKLEIQCTLNGVMPMAIPTCLLFLLEVRGYSKLYDNVEDHGGIPFLVLSFFTFMLFTDFWIYWIHRWLHHPILYAPLHKLHHKWKVPSPYASHAFHPIDGFLQSVPYHVYPFLFPLHKVLYLGLFMFVNVWTISIHDGDYRVPEVFRWVINGCAHHTDHHLFFNYNYGEFFTFWDRLGGSFMEPTAYRGKGLQEQLAGKVDTPTGEDPSEASSKAKQR